MLNNKFLFLTFISVADTSALHVICFFIKMNKILKIIKILNDFYNVVSFNELESVVEFSSSSFISLIFPFIFSYVFFSAIILVNSS